VRRLAQWCYRHRRLVLALWLLALVGATAVSHATGTAYSNTFSLPNTESTRATNLLKAVAPRQSGDTDRIVIATSGGARIDDPQVLDDVTAMLDKIAKLPHVSSVVSPYDAQGAGQIAEPDRTVAFATVTFDAQAQNLPDSLAHRLVDTAQTARSEHVQVAVSGQLASRAGRQSIGGTGIGIIAAAVVLFLVFGSLSAMALPLVSALVSLGTAIAIVGVLSHGLKMPQFSNELILLIGLGVGVDYALFIVSRHRQSLLRGEDPETSVITAIDTSGRAVLFAGIIVCIALLGMFALRVSFLYGLAVAASIGVALTMFAALTLLPALLGFFGPHILSRRQQRRIGMPDAHREGSGFWSRWTRVLERRPWTALIAGLLIMLVLAIPFLSLRLGNSDAGNDPKGSTTRQAYDLLAKGFGPGFNGPLQLTAEVRSAGDRAAVDRVVRAIREQPGVAGVGPVRIIPGRGESIATTEVFPTSAPQDAATTTLIDHLRGTVIPRAASGDTTRIYVGGTTAIFVDFARVLTSKLPIFIGVVVLLSFALLVVVFRSIAVPLTAAIMNLVSAAAAFGILTAVFQWGWLGTFFGVNRTGPIEAFLPVMLFAILFGLSMDYEVFLISRIHEEWQRLGDNTAAVTHGLEQTGRTITAAAAIMVLVFGAFVLGGELVIKEFGLGLAAAIAVDAVVVRSAIIPSVMLILDRKNWWFPDVLDRVLPRLAVEPELDVPDHLDDEVGQRPGAAV
jgi:RND superfamily putative drug exporter